MRTVFFTLIMCVLLGVNVSGQLACIDELTTAAIDPWVNTVGIFPEDFLTEAPNGDYEISNNGTDFLRSIELEVGEYKLTVRETSTGETCEVDLIVVDQTPPVAVCYDLVMVDVAGDPVLTIDMIDFGSHDSGRGPVVRSLTLNEIATIGPDDPRFDAVTEIEFSQNDVCNEFNVVLNVWDLDGNSNVCWATVQVTDPLSFCAFTPGQRPSFSCRSEVVFFVPEDGSLLIQPEDLIFIDDTNGNLSISIDTSLFAKNAIFTSNDVGSFNYSIRNDITNTKCAGVLNIELECTTDCTNLFSIESKTVASDEVFCLNLSGELEQDILSFQTGIIWNPDVLNFQTLQNSNLQGLTFNLVKPGELIIVWLDENVSAVEGNVQLELCFQAIGNSGESSEVRFGGTLFEITNADLTMAFPQVEDALICIDTCPEITSCDVDVMLACEDVFTDCFVENVQPEIMNNSGQTDACLNGLVPELISETNDGGSCAGAQIVREWFLDVDNNGRFTADEPYCKQIVSIGQEFVNLDPRTIRWPMSFGSTDLESFVRSCTGLETTADLSTAALSCDDDIQLTDIEMVIPEYCETSCGLIGFSFEDILAEANCNQRIRRWTVVDWCLFDANNTDAMSTDGDILVIINDTRDDTCLDCDRSSDLYVAYNDVTQDGFYTYDQTITLDTDSNVELISIEGDTEFVITDAGSDQLIEFTASAGGCTILESDENLIWEFSFIAWRSSGRPFTVQKRGVNFTLSASEINPENIEGEFLLSVNLVSLCGNRISDPNNLLGEFSTLNFTKIVDRAEVAADEIPLFANPVIGDLSKSVFEFSINNEALSTYANGTYGIPISSLIATGNELSIHGDESSALNGISTLDLVLLLRYLIGENELEPVAEIAGDLDKSGDLTLTKDIILMSNLILGKETEIPGEDFFFIPSTVSLDDLDPFDFENSFSRYSFNENDINMTDGITVDVYKYGDLNNNFTTIRNLEPATLAYKNMEMEAGATIDVQFKLSSDQLTQFYGAQAEIIFDNATIESLSVEEGVGFDYIVDGDKLRFLVASETELEELVFSVQLVAQTNAILEDILRLSEAFETEFINRDFAVSPINLSAELTSPTGTINHNETINVYPNPAHDEVTLKVSESLVGKQMYVFNSLGQLEYSQTVNQTTSTLEASSVLSTGLKLIKIGDGKVIRLLIE